MTYKLQNAKILIVDDMVPMQTLLRSLLGIFGFRDIEIARNGEEGFEKFCMFQPDLVLADWIMSPIDGIEMTQMIRNDPRSPNRFTPIILMTGYSSRMHVEEARDKGVTEFVVKPFTARDLFSKLEHIIEKPRQFVDADSFFGPDRRRRNKEDFEGGAKRNADHRPKKPSFTDPKD
jgi:two-component system, chemotaxis family, chemotaxis protein CheY